IASQLLFDKLVIGKVEIKGFDDVVAIPVRIRITNVLIGSRRVCIPGYIKPMSSPTLTIARRIQQSVDDPRERIRQIVFQEIVNRICGWRQTDEVKRHSPQNCELVGRRGWSQTIFLQFSKDELVNRRLTPGLILYALW